MDSVGQTQRSPARRFEQLSEIRAEKRERLRGRNNVTSCRSPPRELDTGEIKNKLKEKRHEEFLRRRSVSPRPSGTKSSIESTSTESTSTKSTSTESTSTESTSTESTSTKSTGTESTSTKSTSTVSTGTESTSSSSRSSAHTMRHHSSISQLAALQTSTPEKQTANGHPKMIVTPTSSGTEETPNTSKQDSPWSENTPETIPGGAHENTPASSSTAWESDRHCVKGRPKKQRSQKVNIQTESVFQNPSMQSQIHIEKKVLEDSSMRTEPGFVLVRESDIERLARYLEEALWREDKVKQKLVALQKTTSHLMNSSDTIWTSRFSEDVLRRKINALEAQLHVCLQKFPADRMKKLLVQMEQQRLLYEEKALDALQRAAREKAEAVSRAHTLQEAVHSERAEALRWQRLYEELNLTSDRLKQDQHFNQQLQQRLCSQEELFRDREDELGEEVSSLRQDSRELQYNMSLLEEDNQTLREEIQQLRDGGESQDFSTQQYRLPEKVEGVRRDVLLEEQLHQSEEMLQLRQRECEELQMELDVMKQECQSSQVRLSQCREELRKLSHSRRIRTRCVFGWSVCVAVFLLLAVAVTATLCLWHPPFREQAEHVYADVWTRIEGYLREASSPHSGCFRPI